VLGSPTFLAFVSRLLQSLPPFQRFPVLGASGVLQFSIVGSSLRLSLFLDFNEAEMAAGTGPDVFFCRGSTWETLQDEYCSSPFFSQGLFFPLDGVPFRTLLVAFSGRSLSTHPPTSVRCQTSSQSPPPVKRQPICGAPFLGAPDVSPNPVQPGVIDLKWCAPPPIAKGAILFSLKDFPDLFLEVAFHVFFAATRP